MMREMGGMILSHRLINRVVEPKENISHTKVKVFPLPGSSKLLCSVDPLSCKCQDIGYRMNGLRKRIADICFQTDNSNAYALSQVNAACGAMNHMAKEVYRVAEEIQKRRRI